ncbi:INO80 complex subunit C [Corythoichthys intestinalis]|uniref:INO80 complex subunit C n=1 Tax=Corythoichthys intestinalis TaxID=161448 RepID=UPI0025A549BB|nr:INO80 complex subunit C [Corythoichthys intestinalis]
MASQLPITIKNQTLSAGSTALRGKKRPCSPAVSVAQQPGGGTKKKKAPLMTQITLSQMSPVEVVTDMKATGLVESTPLTSSSTSIECTAKAPPFKDPTFMHSGIGGAAAGKKNRTWKNLKQILVLERTLPWKMDDPNYYNIDAPPSLKPSKKYSDISGLPANYTDPQTKLRFTSTEEFSYIRLLPTDVVTGYLALRKATCIVP